MKKILFLLFPLYLQAQDTPLGNWKDYLSYKSASYVAEADDRIYCVANGGLFYIEKLDETVNRLSKVNGLSDSNIKLINYDQELKIALIAYQNCNIDLLINNRIINISDIKRKEISGIKTINSIVIRERIAYLATSIGLILIDIENAEVKDTYNIGDENKMYAINSCAFAGDSIFAATSSGVFFAKVNNANLADYNNWELYDNRVLNYENMIYTSTGLILDTSANISSINYNANYNILIRAYKDSIVLDDMISLKHPKFENIKFAISENNSTLWVADSINGLLKFEDLALSDVFQPSGPNSNTIFRLEYINENLYNCHGGYINFGHLWNKQGVSIMNKNQSWRNYNYFDLDNARDIVAVASNGNQTYFASYYNGIPMLEKNEFEIRYGNENTNGALDTIDNWVNDRRMKISDLKLDRFGNLWGLNSNVKNPLFVKRASGEWLSFSMNQPLNNLLFGELLIDFDNQKWGIMGRGGGIFIYNDNNTVTNLNDDQYKFLNTNFGSGNLPSMNIYCFENDLDGEVWVGTDKGVAVFYNPEAIFSNYNFDAQQILITEGDYGQYLLSEEKITCISVDGGNRKWIGTEKSGIFLLSEDGQQEIHHFTKNNSPLFSNKIIDIAINNENGEVFIGTELGLLSYRSDATKGADNQNETHVFPNPVNESYLGPIAIIGLVKNANIKITDIAGELVFESKANGGTAIWSGKNKNGARVPTGIYLVFSTDFDGEENMVSKILFIH